MSHANIVPDLSVLFVEDEEDIRLIVEMSFRLDQKIKVRSFASGEAAIGHVRSTTETYDVALLNIVLPDMQGTALLQHLRRESATRHATILFITGLVPPGGPNAYGALGVDGVILKPFDPLHLASTVRNLARASLFAPQQSSPEPKM